MEKKNKIFFSNKQTDITMLLLKRVDKEKGKKGLPF